MLVIRWIGYCLLKSYDHQRAYWAGAAAAAFGFLPRAPPFFGAAFLAGDFFAAPPLGRPRPPAAAFGFGDLALAGDFLGAAFLAGDFLAGDRLAGDFFAAAAPPAFLGRPRPPLAAVSPILLEVLGDGDEGLDSKRLDSEEAELVVRMVRVGCTRTVVVFKDRG